MQITRNHLPRRVSFRPSRRARRWLRAAAAALWFTLGAAACAAFGGQSGRLMPNAALPTLGGTQLWTDLAWDAGWKVQRHAWTGHARLLDPAGVRRAWGGADACLAALHGHAAGPPAAAATARPLVVLVHGLGRSHRSLGALRERLEAEGLDVLPFEYASTRGGLADHAGALAGALEGLRGPREVSFVTHSLGGLVVRELLRDDAAPWRARHHLGRAVTLAAPHRGAEIAARLGEWTLLRAVAGPCFVALGDGTAAALPRPPLELGVVVGARGDGAGWNPWVSGDDDGLVAASEATLPGAADVLVARVGHTFIMDDPAVLEATLAFLRTGRFRPDARGAGPPGPSGATPRRQ